MPTALSTDLYQLTMAAGYHVFGETGEGSFELWVRHLPPGRGYLIAAGLDQALEYLEQFHFEPDEVEYLRHLPALASVPSSFFDDYLPHLRFGGDVWAIPEGTPVFAGEPLLRVTASLPEAQLVETALLATVLFQTMVATKARRVVDAAEGRPVVEFGARRAHGADAGTLAARAAFIGGCVATSQLECGIRFGVPVSGTMAHSWVMIHEQEAEAFRRYADLYGAAAVLLVDTYDSVAATHTIVAEGLRPAAVRLDSGDLNQLSRDVRRVLDSGGRAQTRIVASGDLDEHRVAALVSAGAPIDGFGVGTALSTSQDAPSLSGVYKLVEIARDGRNIPTAKRSPLKQTQPGRKQVWRVGSDDVAAHDVLGTADETGPEAGCPLMERVMHHGRRVGVRRTLAETQARCHLLVQQLPREVRVLNSPRPYEVRISDALEALATGGRQP